jgi:hypothetical protein
MAEEPEVIQEQMEETRSALADKLGALGQKITGTVDSVSEAVEEENTGRRKEERGVDTE